MVLVACPCSVTVYLLESDATALFCRSQYAEEFRDSQGFGWQDQSEHKFDWQTLVNKKVSSVQLLCLCLSDCKYCISQLAWRSPVACLPHPIDMLVLYRPRRSHG